MMKGLKPICLFLTLLLVAGMLAACGRGSGDDKNTNRTAEPVTVDGSDPWGSFPEQLGVRDFGAEGRQFRIYTQVDDPAGFFPMSCDRSAGQTGATVPDAMFSRDMQMWENYGIDVSYERIGTKGDDGSALRQTLITALLGGMDVCDMVTSNLSGSILDLYTAGILYDCTSIPGMDMDHPWWASYFAEGASFKGSLYYAAGMAAGGGFWGTAYAMICNLYLAQEVYPDGGTEPMDIFDLVNSGNWTLDTFYNIVRDYSRNLDGEGEFSVYQDLMAYAHVHGEITAACHFIAAGGKFSTLDADGGIVTDCLFAESTVNLVEKLTTVFDSIKSNYDHDAFFKKGEQVNAFLQDRALFIGNSMTYVQNLTEMSHDYAIIPCPKADTMQQNYYTGINPWSVGFLAIPYNIADPDYIGYATELLGYCSYYTVRPSLYDTILCKRLAKDPRQRAIMDTIYDYLYVDLNFLNNFAGTQMILSGSIMDPSIVYSTRINTTKIALPLAIEKFERDISKPRK